MPFRVTADVDPLPTIFVSVNTPLPLCLHPTLLDVPAPNVNPRTWNGATLAYDAFLALPRVPGYRYEFLDGTARIRPVDHPLILLAARTSTVQARTAPPPSSCTVRPLAPDHRDALVALWTDIFTPLPDYATADRTSIRADAQKRIDALLAAPATPNTTRSRVALRNDTVIGGLLADTFGPHPQLDVIFVAPSAQRRGAARALLHAFAKATRSHSHLVSSAHPANRESRQWHRRMGFVPLPDRPLVRHLQAHLRANLAHDHVPATAGKQAKTMLDRIADRLRRAEHEHPAAVHPIRWAQDEDLLPQYLVD
jgi:GNAT superfamily N-acetyltransferase